MIHKARLAFPPKIRNRAGPPQWVRQRGEPKFS